MGRTNKLVDGCYSYWQGALFGLLPRLGPAYLLQSRAVHAAVAGQWGAGSVRVPPAVVAMAPDAQAGREAALHKVRHDAMINSPLLPVACESHGL